MNEAGLLEARIPSGHVLENRTDQRHLGQIGDGEKAGAQPIFDIMIVVRDVIGERGDLSLEARPTVQLQIDRILCDAGGWCRLSRGRAGLRQLNYCSGSIQMVRVLSVGIQHSTPDHT